MYWILGWVIYGLIVGLLAKVIHPGKDEPSGFLSTMIIGVLGSYTGGFLNWALGVGGSPFSPSGLIMGTVGGILCCWAYRSYLSGAFKQED